jgi:hypothetical protein
MSRRSDAGCYPQRIDEDMPHVTSTSCMGQQLRVLRGGVTMKAPVVRSKGVNLVAGTYTLLGISALATLLSTLRKHPLWPFQMESLEWCRAWLITTIGDYYGACFALCAVILASENRWAGIAWSLGCCLFGAPVCCSWVVSRVLRKGTLALPV